MQVDGYVNLMYVLKENIQKEWSLLLDKQNNLLEIKLKKITWWSQ